MWYSETVALLIGIISLLIFSILFTFETFMVTQCAGKGKWTKTLFALQKFSIFLGILFFVIGIVAGIVNQPFHVFFPLCMDGLLLILVMLLQFLVSNRLYSSFQKKQKEETVFDTVEMNDKQRTSEDRSPDTLSKKKTYQDIYKKSTK